MTRRGCPHRPHSPSRSARRFDTLAREHGPRRLRLRLHGARSAQHAVDRSRFGRARVGADGGRVAERERRSRHASASPPLPPAPGPAPRHSRRRRTAEPDRRRVRRRLHSATGRSGERHGGLLAQPFLLTCANRADAAVRRELAGILRGTVDPLQQLFPDGSTELATSLYRDTPEAIVYNQLLPRYGASACRGSRRPRRRRPGFSRWRRDRRHDRVDCAGARPRRTEYLFTDVGASLVRQARERFASHAFMEFATFDLEQDPCAAGLGDRAVRSDPRVERGARDR